MKFKNPEDHFSQALSNHRRADFVTARHLYELVLAANPEHIQASHNLGLLELQTGNAIRAAELLRKAVHHLPNDPTYRSNLAFALQASGNLTRAVEEGKIACELDAKSAALRSNLGKIFLEAGEVVAAIEAFKIALELDQESIKAYLNLSYGFEAAMKFDEAKKVVSDALKKFPGEPNLENQLGSLHLKGGNFEIGFKYWNASGIDLDLRDSVGTKKQIALGELRGKKLHVKFGANFLHDVMFARFLRKLKQYGIQTIITCPKSYFGLFVSNTNIDRIYESGSRVDADYQFDSRALPKLLSVKSLPDIYSPPYFFSDPLLSAKITKKLGIELKKNYIVIHRQSSKDEPGKKITDSLRSKFDELKDEIDRSFSGNLEIALAYSFLDTTSQQIIDCHVINNASGQPLNLSLEHMTALIGSAEYLYTDDPSAAGLCGTLGINVKLEIERESSSWEWFQASRYQSLWFPTVSLNFLGKEFIT